MHKISICTVCMNRLYHLRETLPLNIRENKDGPPVEFVVLDYNSRDGMEAWAREHLRPYIETGLVKYYRTTDPDFFDMSHSKNMSAQLATGDVICNIDADNFAGPGYTSWVAKQFEQQHHTPILTIIRKDFCPYSDLGGKVCFQKTMFDNVRGYDESLVGYGLDDIDLVNRLEKAGGERVFIDDPQFLHHISHSDEERIVNYSLSNKLENIYISAARDLRSRNKALYLMNDSTFIEVEYVFAGSAPTHFATHFLGWSVEQDGQRKGTFQREQGKLQLNFEGDSLLVLEEEKPGILATSASRQRTFWKNISPDNKFFNILVKGYGECINRYKFSSNDNEQTIINPTGWGRGKVFLNFDYDNPIYIH